MSRSRKSIYIIFILALAGLGYFLIKKDTLSNDCKDCNVIVILVDTLRADHLPAYGYTADTAPFITSVMNKSTLFNRAFSASSFTAPATASIFTSHIPSEHGVITGFVASKSMARHGSSIKLDKILRKYMTLGELMTKNGFTSVGVADNLNIGAEMGFDRGFKLFKKYNDKGSKRVNKTVAEFLSTLDKKERLFLYLHYMDPHAPYKPQKPWYDECMAKTKATTIDEMVCAYDSEIHNLDHNIEDLFKSQGFLDNSIVVFVADHGEEFFEHGDRGHGKTLYTELLHVPFSIYHPKWKPQKIEHNVHTVDLMPTLAGMLKFKKDDNWRGHDLFHSISNNSFDTERSIYSERLRSKYSNANPKNWKRSIIEGKFHYILTGESGKKPEFELFDMEKDFAEQNNILANEPELSQKLAAKIAALPSPDERLEVESTEVELDEDLAKELRSLGYIN
jgi:arylsulfatase A-like enzyme